MRIVDGVLQKYEGEDSHVVIPKGVTVIGECAFEDDFMRDKIYVPDDDWGLFGRDGLDLRKCGFDPDSVRNVTDYGETIFIECGFDRSDLESVVIPEGVTVIRKWAFSDCSSLRDVVIPDSVTEIENYAFKDCSKLRRVVIHTDKITFGSAPFKGCDNLNRCVGGLGLFEDEEDDDWF